MFSYENFPALSNIRLVATDCDGVLTDGGMYYSELCGEIKRFHALDGMGFGLLQDAGIKTAIITAEKNPMVEQRAKKLNVTFLYTGRRDKLAALRELCEKLEISLSQAAYLGDDVLDIPAIQASGFGCAPCSTLDQVKSKADYITKRAGGDGCFREVADLILQARTLVQNQE